ncbi:MAG: glycoside hydrolase family 9 protein [Bacteroidetes bacterium]|nr:glycoside hydrolase family 9 protein [Bacteroidota bacterium]
MKKKSISILIITLLMVSLAGIRGYAQKLSLNELEYFETTGFNVLVYSNQYTGFFYDEKTAGIEIIHHGVRTATNGAVRLTHTPEQWDLIPKIVNRKVDRQNNRIEVDLRYEEYDFNAKMIVMGEDNGICITTILDKPLPKQLEGYAGFNLEFLPSAYFEKTYIVDGAPGIFPRYPCEPMEVRPIKDKIKQFAGHSTFDDRGRGEFVLPEPLAVGSTIILAPEDPERRIQIRSTMGELLLFDGRNVAQNGWFVVRSLFPPNRAGEVAEWHLTASTIPDWKRQPNIGYSQVGYHPSEKKVAIIELDKNDSYADSVSILQVTPQGDYVTLLKCKVQDWGQFLRYKYALVDFSSLADTGLYCIQYKDQRTKPFPISQLVFKSTWQQTLGIWFPVQMDHMFVNEAYRVWHGEPYRDDALQAPVNHIHFDGYRMGPTTETKYKPLERIPGLNIGGWFDAGDFDIQTGSHCAAILSFVETWEQFGVRYDETFIDQKSRYVDIHRPDGVPDLLQQIEHGTLQLVAQQKNIGHAVRGIVVPNLHQYHHLGDASTVTDNLPYNSKLKPYETDGVSSGTLDDRWVFSNREPWLNYYSVAALAAANRALKDYNKQLADEALAAAINAWEKEHRDPVKRTSSDEEWFRSNSELGAALELYITTRESKYLDRFNELVWTSLDSDSALQWNMQFAGRAAIYLDDAYREKLKPYVIKYKALLVKLEKQNPFGVPLETRGWGANSIIIQWATTNYYLNKIYPEIIDPDYIFRAARYLYGCHPYSNLSFVSGVGVQSKKITYGNNRADFSFIAGGVVPGILILKPDFPENKEDWPFFWGENECVVDICASYIYFANAVDELANRAK